MNERERADAPTELRRAAEVHLTRDLAEVAWREGQRAHQRTAWAIGGALAAAVAIGVLIGGPTLGMLSSSDQLGPAGVSTDGPAPDDRTGTKTPIAEKTSETTEGPLDGGDPEATPLGHGVAIQAIPDWQVVPQGYEHGGVGLVYTKTCLQPAGVEISRFGCLNGVVIVTGMSRDEIDLVDYADVQLPKWGTMIYRASPPYDDKEGIPGLAFTTIEDALVVDPDETVLTYAEVGQISNSADQVTGTVQRIDPAGNYGGSYLADDVAALMPAEGKVLTLNVQDATLCTEDHGVDAPARVIDCAVLQKRAQDDADLPISVIYDKSDRLWRMSEDPRHLG